MISGSIGDLIAVILTTGLFSFMAGHMIGWVSGKRDQERIDDSASYIRVEDLDELGKGRVVLTYRDPLEDPGLIELQRRQKRLR